MNAITAISAAVLMMSSRQIAEETGKEHFHVMRDLRALKDQLGPMFKGSIQNWIHPQNGQSYEEFLIDKDTCLTLLLGYDAVARMKVVKRWQELEAQATPALPDFSNPVAAARAWADAKESELRTAEALALAAPKAEYVDRYVAANGAKGFRQVAKLLGANEHAFRAWLQDEKIMYRLGGEWTAHQCHIDAGRFVVKTGVAQANEHAFNTTKFTPKGVNWVAGLWGQHQARLAQGERA
ncbi:phage regulatory protein/antirepressor Ant [Delftia tsuruhatensis]|jgi:phage antirepressor YoqD-like protein|uniref:phage antirepressor KilAC domain-containing protein n=1 Tax=Delftia tsuruhatensis TaxID=180282 RepID=UPI002260DEE3|nr:phage antirepressor KilAC domain-containing protein [Delftia tsuruhatensis]MCX7508166.1 phage antirepressor KilAC domain-containing protein [Delftia tsuruhatensis]MDH0852170.1 phage regulatory protein/antirepressor Ant [Delftia tsuruhatensis]